jgi:opacity protein-like surface antigen
MESRLAYVIAALTLITASASASAQTAPASAQMEQTGFYTSGRPAALPGSAFRASGPPAEAPPQSSRADATGYDFGGFRTEVERYRGFGVTDPRTGATIENSSVMFNGLYDFPAGPRLNTFVGAGFGALNRIQRIPGASSDEWDSAYQVRGGLTYDISKALKGLLEFRQQGILAGSTPKVSFKDRGVLLGLKYQIP